METFMSATSEASVGQRRLLKRLADAASSSAVNYPHIFKSPFAQLICKKITTKLVLLLCNFIVLASRRVNPNLMGKN